MRPLLLLMLLAACSRGSQNPNTDDTTEVAAEDTWSGLYGKPPNTPIGPPPAFVATNMDGGRRSYLNALGGPSVLWFVPNEPSSC
jgi:hypothetical protein